MPDADLPLWFLGLALGLWLVTALISAIEMAIQSLRSSEIEQLAEGSRSEKYLRRIAENPQVYSYSLTFVRVFLETTVATLIGVTCALYLEPVWVALLVAIVVVTLGTFLLVGITPRMLGRAYATTVLRYTAWIARGVRVMFGGVAKALYFFGSKLTPASGRYVGFRDEEQLLTMVDEATELDMLEEDDRELIHSVFEFGDTLVREIMVPRIDMITVDADETLSYGLDQFLNRAISRIPVIGKDADEVMGVLYLRDVVKYQRRNPETWEHTLVSELIKPAVFMPESKKADDALRQMQEDFNHLALVVDEYGGVAGLVTLEDLIEELVGEIADEYDRDVPEVQQLDEHRYEVDAKLPIGDLGELFDRELDDDDVDSVGGLLTKVLGRIPVQGATVEIEGLRLTAKRMQRRPKRVVTVLVEQIHTEQQALWEGTITDD